MKQNTLPRSNRKMVEQFGILDWCDDTLDERLPDNVQSFHPIPGDRRWFAGWCSNVPI